MIIRKEFKYEMGHIVRNAWSRRCSYNAHGHSYRAEFLLTGECADRGQMLTDFGFIKQYFHPFIDAFDHSFWLWDRESDEHIVKFFKNNFERVVVSPYSTTAEMQAKLFYIYMDLVICYLREKRLFENGEDAESIAPHSVIVHETTTGYAQSFGRDCFPPIDITKLEFSIGIKDEWSFNFRKFYDDLMAFALTQTLY